MPHGITNNYKCIIKRKNKFIAQEHQKNVLHYFINISTYKGLLLFHKLGSGKSCSSILIADEMITQSKTKKIYVITPGSLRENYIKEYCYKCGKNPVFLQTYYTFITSNYAVGKHLPDFTDSIVIIDEVHNLINGVKNQSIHKTLIYNQLMKSNCRILALSGTPIFNNIWEWPLLGNLLKPNTFTNILENNQLDTSKFMENFDINEKTGEITPYDKVFERSLKGIISYFPGDTDDKKYPTVILHDPILTRMTLPQDYYYFNLAHVEKITRNKGPPPLSEKKSNPSQYNLKNILYIIAIKYIMTRLFSNFYYTPLYQSSSDPHTKDEITKASMIKNYQYKKTGETNYNKKKLITNILSSQTDDYLSTQTSDDAIKKQEKHLKNLEKKITSNIKTIYESGNVGWINNTTLENNKLSDIYSRKILSVILNIVKHWNSKHVLFSYFKTKSGVNIIHALLTKCNIKSAIYSGDVSDSNRTKILETFNAENNRYGEKIKILLITEAGAEGINILEAQHIHILESSTREMIIQQAIGRVVRYKSHAVDGRTPMPLKEQVVNVWRYWSISNNPNPIEITPVNITDDEKQKKIIITNKNTVDEMLYNKGRIQYNTIQQFMLLLQKASVTPYKPSPISLLPDYTKLNVNSQLNDACKESDNRYQSLHPLRPIFGKKDLKNIILSSTTVADKSNKKLKLKKDTVLSTVS